MAKTEGFADDYAFLIRGLLDLYEAGQEVRWLEWAWQLQQKMDELFWDKESRGYFTATTSDPSILIRMKEGMFIKLGMVFSSIYMYTHTLSLMQTKMELSLVPTRWLPPTFAVSPSFLGSLFNLARPMSTRHSVK